jgi:acyl transferase domain-containing protein
MIGHGLGEYVAGCLAGVPSLEQALDLVAERGRLEHTVRFGEALEGLIREGYRVFLEVGPGSDLGTRARKCIGWDGSQVATASLPDTAGGRPERETVHESLGVLWCAGVDVDWGGFHARGQRRLLSLPTYPFERQRYRAHSLGGPEPSSGPVREPDRERADISDCF